MLHVSKLLGRVNRPCAWKLFILYPDLLSVLSSYLSVDFIQLLALQSQSTRWLRLSYSKRVSLQHVLEFFNTIKDLLFFISLVIFICVFQQQLLLVWSQYRPSLARFPSSFDQGHTGFWSNAHRDINFVRVYTYVNILFIKFIIYVLEWSLVNHPDIPVNQEIGIDWGVSIVVSSYNMRLLLWNYTPHAPFRGLGRFLGLRN